MLHMIVIFQPFQIGSKVTFLEVNFQLKICLIIYVTNPVKLNSFLVFCREDEIEDIQKVLPHF